MTGVLTSIAAAIALTAVQVGAVSAFALPLALVHLPLIAITLEVSAFRFVNAYAIAATTGLLVDLLVAPSFGAETAMLLALTFLLVTLFTRVFTNASLPALLALTAVGFLGLHLLVLGRNIAGFTLTGDDLGILFGWSRFLSLMAGLAVQLIMTLLVTAAVVGIRRALGTIFVLR